MSKKTKKIRWPTESDPCGWMRDVDVAPSKPRVDKPKRVVIGTGVLRREESLALWRVSFHRSANWALVPMNLGGVLGKRVRLIAEIL